MASLFLRSRVRSNSSRKVPRDKGTADESTLRAALFTGEQNNGIVLGHAARPSLAVDVRYRRFDLDEAGDRKLGDQGRPIEAAVVHAGHVVVKVAAFGLEIRQRDFSAGMEQSKELAGQASHI